MFRQWGKSTFDYLKSILDTEEAYKYQMNYITNFTLFDYIIADVSEVIFPSYMDLVQPSHDDDDDDGNNGVGDHNDYQYHILFRNFLLLTPSCILTDFQKNN